MRRWDYLWCTETLPQETYFEMDGVNDMFWAKSYNKTYPKCVIFIKFKNDELCIEKRFWGDQIHQ